MEDINQTGNGKSISCGCFHFQLQCLDADFEENPILNKTSNVFVNHTKLLKCIEVLQMHK